MNKFGHDGTCKCRRCFAQELGHWWDELGRKTKSGGWKKFATISYRTPAHPWRSGFAMSGASRPSPEFVDHFFGYFICWIEAQLGERVDYVVVDQYGNLNGRLHQHALLGASGLDRYPRKEMESWLCRNAGYSRVLPFERGAAYYLARFAGRDLSKSEWRLRLGEEEVQLGVQPKRGLVVAPSADLPKGCFHQSLPSRRR